MSSAARLVLELVGGEHARVELPESGVLTLGCSRERAGLVVEGTDVAGVHCAIGRTKSGSFALKDLGSEAGTRVNGKHVQGVLLKPGDEIVIGSRVVRVHAAPPETLPDEASADLPAIPGYRVRRRLGRGGMGEVWLAVQESLAREVALKVLSAQVEADGEFVARFQAEARSAAALNHPNVVTVYDVGAHGGLHYLSMEYMDAGNLEERVTRAGPLPWREVVRILQEAAAGLVYAESKGIVHRDLKPANLMQNLAGATKIADLGLATHVDEAASRASGHKVFGTPHFMSPEQVRGERLDARSDIYSLGATAYRLLTGATPFEGSSSREILRAQLRDDPTPLLQRAPDLPEALAMLVQRAMAKDPSERPPSAAALLRGLQEVAAADVAQAPAHGGIARALTWLVPLAAIGAGAAWFALGREGGSEITHVDAANPTERVTGTDAITTEAGGARGAGTHELGSAAWPGSAAAAQQGAAALDPGDDTALKLFEAEARVAYLELETRELAPSARAEALRALAETYRGTTTAGQAAAQGENIAQEAQQNAAARRAEEARVSTSIDAAIAAIDGLGPDATPAAKLSALAALATPPELAEDATYTATRRALAEGVVEDALERARARLELADTLSGQGDFAGARRELEALIARLADIETLEIAAADEEPQGTDTGVDTAALIEITARARKRLSGLDDDAREYADSIERSDRERLARELARGNALADDLAQLDLERAAQRLERIELAGPRARALVLALRDDALRARTALDTLAREYAGVGWRRTLVTDPRERRTTGYDAVGVDGTGVLVDVGGRVEKLPWSVFGSQAREVHRLFYDRLAREWNAEERAAIATLLRLVSVAQALAIVRPALEDARLGERDRRSLAEVFAEAREWSAGTPEEPRTVLEARALVALTEALALAEEGRAAHAARLVEALFVVHGDTLLVTLLSDGSWSGIEPAPTYETLAPPVATEASAPSAGDPAAPETPQAPGGDDDGQGASAGGSEDGPDEP